MIFIHLRQHHISCQKIPQQYTCLGNRTTKVICAVLSSASRWYTMADYEAARLLCYPSVFQAEGQTRVFFRVFSLSERNWCSQNTAECIWPLLSLVCISSSLMRHVGHSLKAVFLNLENFKRCRLQIYRIPQPDEESWSWSLHLLKFPRLKKHCLKGF